MFFSIECNVLFCIVLVSCINNLEHEIRVTNVYKFSFHFSVCMHSFSYKIQPVICSFRE